MNYIKYVVLGIGVVCVIAVGAYVASLQQTDTTAYGDSSDVIEQWIDTMLVLTKETPGFSPPIAARAFGYIGVSAYESVRFGIPGSKSLAGQINDFDETLLADIDSSGTYDWNIVANADLATMVRALYPNMSQENKTRVDAREAALLETYSVGLSQEVVDASVALGRQVGERMARYADSDGQSLAYTTNFPHQYTPQEGEGLWVPTANKFQPALQPYWGSVRPFMTKNIKDTLPVPPPTYSLDPESQFAIENQEVYDTVKNLTKEQLVIAKFWSDDPGKTPTPPGHSISILRQVLAQENSSLAEGARALAQLGMGVHDSFIACWYAKYVYNLIRPITVIQENSDPEFNVPLDTPPFPEYPSGHSTQSGATAQILTDIFGEGYTFTDKTHQNRTDIDGRPRTFNSFDEFAEEAAISRLYGGIHYRSAIEEGLKQGKEIGQNIGSLSFSE